MATNLETATTTALCGNYVLLRADTLRLLLPQHEVGAAEYLAVAPQPSDVAGLLRQDGDEQERPFVALSKHMSLLPRCPDDRFVFTALGNDGDNLGWCWNEIKVLINIELRPQLLPAVLMAPYTPVDCFVEHDGEIAYLSTVERLRAYALSPRS